MKKKLVSGDEVNALVLSDFTKSLPVRHKDFSEARSKSTYRITVFRSAYACNVKIKAEHVRAD